MAERKCKECFFFKLDSKLGMSVKLEDCIGCCTISGNTHRPEDICEAEKGED